MKKIEFTAGQRIPETRLSYLQEELRVDPKRRRARFICDCGTQIVTDLNWVRFLTIRSCGCYKKEELVKKNTKHSQAVRGKQTGAYRSWHALTQRGITKKGTYAHVSVCERWSGDRGFANFLSDMGERPEGHSIERLDNTRGYEPSNCTWATSLQQAQNMRHTGRVTISGETCSIKEWCRRLDISYGLVKQRRQRGMSLLSALTTPIDVSKRNRNYGSGIRL
jgi:hypothetical protein